MSGTSVCRALTFLPSPARRTLVKTLMDAESTGGPWLSLRRPCPLGHHHLLLHVPDTELPRAQQAVEDEQVVLVDGLTVDHDPAHVGRVVGVLAPNAPRPRLPRVGELVDLAAMGQVRDEQVAGADRLAPGHNAQRAALGLEPRTRHSPRSRCRRPPDGRDAPRDGAQHRRHHQGRHEQRGRRSRRPAANSTPSTMPSVRPARGRAA